MSDRKRAFQRAVNAYARVAINAVKLFHSNVELLVLYALLNAPHEVDICGNFFLGLHDDQDLASRVSLDVTTVRRTLRALAAGGFAKPFESQRRFVQEGRAVAANLTPRADISYLWGVDFVGMVDSILLRMNKVQAHLEAQKKSADDFVYVCRQCGSRQSASVLLKSMDPCLLAYGDLKCTGTSPLCRDEPLELEDSGIDKKDIEHSLKLSHSTFAPLKQLVDELDGHEVPIFLPVRPLEKAPESSGFCTPVNFGEEGMGDQPRVERRSPGLPAWLR